MSGVRTLVVWCPDWPLVAAGRCSVPAAVLAAGRVVACSAPARAEGVARGLRRRQAEARCPGLVVVDHDPAADARAFEPVVAAVEGFTPAGGDRPPRGVRGGHAGPVPLLRGRRRPGRPGVGGRGRRACPPARPACRVGIADGPFAAERAARRGVVVPAGRERRVPVRLPGVATLGDAELADLLVRLGIRTLGQLAALPAPSVLARFGPAGAVAHRLARGLDERPLVGPHPAARPHRGRRARPARRADGDRGVRGQGPGRPPPRGPGRPGPHRHPGAGGGRVGARRAPGPAVAARRQRRPDGGGAGRPGAVAARRVDDAAEPTGPPAGSPFCAWCPRRSAPTTAARAASGAATGPRPSGSPGPWPGSRACSGPTPWSPPCPPAAAARLSRSGSSRGASGRAGRRPPAAAVAGADPVARRRPPCTPFPVPAEVTARQAVGGRRPAWSAVTGVGRALARRRAVVGRRRPPPAGPLAGRHGRTARRISCPRTGERWEVEATYD